MLLKLIFLISIIILIEDVDANSTNTMIRRTDANWDHFTNSFNGIVDDLFINNTERLPAGVHYQQSNGYQYPLVADKEPRYQSFSLFLWNTLKEKFDTVLLTKVLIYLVVFKKLVLMIGIVFILIFLPSLNYDYVSSNYLANYGRMSDDYSGTGENFEFSV